jgi:hypothetical protein
MNMDKLVLWGEKIPKSYIRIKEKFDAFLRQIERDSQRGMVSYVDSDLNRLYWYILRNKRYFSEKDLKELKDILDEMVESVWNKA